MLADCVTSLINGIVKRFAETQHIVSLEEGGWQVESEFRREKKIVLKSGKQFIFFQNQVIVCCGDWYSL